MVRAEQNFGCQEFHFLSMQFNASPGTHYDLLVADSWDVQRLTKYESYKMP